MLHLAWNVHVCFKSFGVVCCCVLIVSLFLQFGGKWQLDAVALLREMLLNRTVDMDVKVELLRRGAF